MNKTTLTVPPSRIWYLIALIIFIALPTYAIHHMVKETRAALHQTQTFNAPGATTITINKLGEYTFWEPKPQEITKDKIEVRQLENNKNIEFHLSESHWSQSINKIKHTAIGTIDIQQPGEYQVTIAGDVPAQGILLRYSIWKNLFTQMLRSLTLFALGILIGVIFALIIFVKRSSAIRAARAPTTTSPTPITESNKKTGAIWAMLCHLGTLVGVIVPFGNFITPLLIWAILKDDYPLVDDQGRESLNFQISMLIYYFLAFVMVIFVVGLFLLVLLGLFQLIAVIIASVEAGRGRRFRYPLTVRFIRPLSAT